MAEKITRAELEASIKETEAMIATMVTNKYTHDGETTLDDVIARVCRVVDERTKNRDKSRGDIFNRDVIRGFCEYPHPNPKAPDCIRDVAITDNEFKAIKECLKEGYFIPGGSILSGMDIALKDKDGKREKKSSLSNCYIIPIREDSIEGIFSMMSEMAKTFAHRGGVGVDITILRPEGYKVNNAAKTSTGAVSFMPLFSAVNSTIGQSGRRGAALISIDCRHPDLMNFIWSKADPERVFPRDHMAQDITARELTSWLNSDVCINEVDSNVRDNIASKVNSGKIPDINGANISIKFTDEFFRAVEEDSDKPWIFYFPDINADKDYYNEYWDGVYEHWTGKLIAVASYNVYVTKNNYKKFIGKRLAEGNNPEATEEYLEKLVADGRQHRVGFLNPTAKEILLECAEAGWMRGDPGVFFWDAHCRYSDYPYLSPELRPITTNPCGEISGYPYAACNLGAHVLYKYVENPYQEKAYFDYDKFTKNCIAMALFMNVVNDINTPLHPLKNQVQMEELTKRIGVEFTGLADMLSMLNLDYGSEYACNITNYILTIKALAELYVSIVLAYYYGPVHYADPKFNLAGLEKLVNESPYIKHVIDTFDLRRLLCPNFDKDAIPHNFDKLITLVGLRNVATNTVGPTGSLSILAGNCSSGVEPIFSLFMKRYTRVGDKPYYHVCHAPLARHLLKQMEDDPTITEYDIDEVKKKYHIVEAHELDYMQRIAIQSAVQKACDSSISSTVNLPSTATPEDIAEIYIAAHKAGLKGITIYRDGSMQGVLSVDNRKEKKKNIAKPKVKETEVVLPAEMPIDESTNVPTRDGYTPLKKMPDTCKSIRHAVYWRGYKLYFIVVFDSETHRPMEIFTSNLPIEIAIVDGVFNFQLYQENLSTLTALTRMVSVALRGGIDPEAILKQLKKSAYSIGDMVSLIARVLARSIGNDTENEKASGFTQCPVCRQNTLHRSGGCSHCTNPECMFSRCD